MNTHKTFLLTILLINKTLITYFPLQMEIKYDPGDHVGVLACNRKEIVDAVLKRLKDVDDCSKSVQVQTMKEKLTPTGKLNDK